MALHKRPAFTLKNATGAIEIDRKTGWIRACKWAGRDVDLFQQVRGGIPGYVGGIRVYDEHDRRWYSDLESTFTVAGMSRRGQVVRFRKQFQGAPFGLRITFRMDPDCLHWEVEARKKNRRVADRSLRVYFILPLIAGWDVWAPCKWGEQTFDGMTPFEFMYTQIPYVSDQEIILPMVSHYSRKLDVGYAVVEPIDANVPAAKFGFNNMEKCYNWGSMKKDLRDCPVLETVNYCIGLVGDRPLKTCIEVFLHAGDWRPGLGQVYRHWREFFDPFNDAIYDREGVFLCGTAYVDEHVDRLVACGLKTLEIHGHFQEYSDYYQNGKDRWLKDPGAVLQALQKQAVAQGGKADAVTGRTVEEYCATHAADEILALCGWKKDDPDPWKRSPYHERADLKRRLAALKARGISNHWYFNYTDGFRPRVERDWPDSIAKNEDGSFMTSGWYACHNMNADPKYSFGTFCYESARRIFDDYGDLLDGFFLDCFRHYEIDFAHDDGVTVVNGKPCYSMNASYDEIERRITTEILKPRNLTSFANKPMSIRSMRYCDGQLLEGDGDMYEEKFFWASIANPLFYLWDSHNSGMSTDECLRRCVLHGCYPTCSYRPTDEEIALYRRYLPLFEPFKRRVLCFEPDPLRPPKGSVGKLYTVAGGYIAGIINKHVDAGDEIKYAKTPHALFRVQRGHNVGRVGILHPGDREWREAKFKFDGTFIAVPMPDYRNCAVVKLFVAGKSRKAIGTDRFYQRARMCGDPESSFEDLSAR